MKRPGFVGNGRRAWMSAARMIVADRFEQGQPVVRRLQRHVARRTIPRRLLQNSAQRPPCPSRRGVPSDTTVPIRPRAARAPSSAGPSAGNARHSPAPGRRRSGDAARSWAARRDRGRPSLQPATPAPHPVPGPARHRRSAKRKAHLTGPPETAATRPDPSGKIAAAPGPARPVQRGCRCAVDRGETVRSRSWQSDRPPGRPLQVVGSPDR